MFSQQMVEAFKGPRRLYRKTCKYACVGTIFH